MAQLRYFNGLRVEVSRLLPLLLLGCLLFTAGCSLVKYKPEPLDAASVQASVRDRRLDDPAFLKYVHAMIPATKPDGGGSWDLNLLTLTALYFSPALRVAHDQVSLAQGQLQTASSYINPRMNVPLEHHSDTSGYSSAWTLGTVIDFVYELRGKRAARIAGARARLQAARIHVLQTAWDIRGRLHKAYLEYYLARQKERLAAARLKLLQQKQTLLQKRSALGESGAAAADRAELEMQQARLDLSGDKAGVSDAWHALTVLTGLPAAAFDNISFNFAAFEPGTAVQQLNAGDLQESALLHRTDVVRALYEYRVAEQALKLEIEKQYPDITLSPGFVFDQGDRIWSLGASWVLPLFNHNRGPIREALAKRKIMQSGFLELQTRLLSRLHDALNRYDKLRSYLSVSREIRDRMKKQGRAIRNQYRHGYSSRLDLINTELELNNSKNAVLSSRGRLLKTVVQLEQLVQKPLPGETDIDKPLEYLYKWEQVPDLAENTPAD